MPELTPAQAKAQAQRLALEAVDQLQVGEEATARIALEKALEADADLLGPGERDDVVRLVDELRAAAAGTNASLVQAKMDALDHATHDFAGRRMNRAIARVVQEIASHDASLALTVGAHQTLGAGAILLRGTEQKGAVVVAERLRGKLAEKPLDLGGEPRVVTLSAGVATACEQNDFATDDLVSRADSALYRAKRLGRDRVEVWV